MQKQEHSEHIETNKEASTLLEESENENQEQEISASDKAAQARKSARPGARRFDWRALSAALVTAAFFALTARFNSQPSPSYIPAAIFSATGCGLLVTAIRKLRKLPGAGLLEAGLASFGMALFQFAITFTYPDVFTIVTTVPSYGGPFLITWGLVALLALILSLVGATIGHLAFSPQRPLPASVKRQQGEDEDADQADESEQSENSTDEDTEPESAQSVNEDTEPESAQGEKAEEEEEEEAEEQTLGAAMTAPPQRSVLNYAVTVLLLGLLPMMAGYVFAAAYDFILGALNVNAISPALYPTLSLLSGLLPWRLAAPINLSSANGSFIVFTLLWRVPDSVLGNPNLFDVQALENIAFTATALALLLITSYNSDSRSEPRQPAPWGVFLFLEALFGLVVILPANLWLLRGLEGILQFQTVLAQLPTIQLLNPLLFTLNLLTGVLFSVIMALIAKRQYQLWTLPRLKATSELEEEDEPEAVDTNEEENSSHFS